MAVLICVVVTLTANWFVSFISKLSRFWQQTRQTAWSFSFYVSFILCVNRISGKVVDGFLNKM